MMQNQPISAKSALQSREPPGRAPPRVSSVYFLRLAGQIGSFPLVDLMQPILNLICTLLAKGNQRFLKRKSESSSHSIEELFH
jgi:hypothetical protein